MIIETKFNIDEVKWFMRKNNNEPLSGKIIEIKARTKKDWSEPEIIYVLQGELQDSSLFYIDAEYDSLYGSKELLFSTVLKKEMDRVTKLFKL